MKSLILVTTTRMLLPVMILFSVFLLYRGHNEPGGGFVGGLVAASAVILHALANSVGEARRLLRLDPRTYVAIGLGIALASSLVGPLAGRVYFEGAWIRLPVPGTDGFPAGTPLAFDIGVYILVIGVTSMILLALLEEE